MNRSRKTNRNENEIQRISLLHLAVASQYFNNRTWWKITSVFCTKNGGKCLFHAREQSLCVQLALFFYSTMQCYFSLRFLITVMKTRILFRCWSSSLCVIVNRERHSLQFRPIPEFFEIFLRAKSLRMPAMAMKNLLVFLILAILLMNFHSCSHQF